MIALPSDRFELKLGEAGYPSMVAQLPGAPGILYVLGDPAVLERPCLSIVGARRATPYGKAAAELVATVAAQSDIVVVSGGAVGCDQAAGRAALNEHGKHVIVLGCGADVVYPKGLLSLYREVLEGGGAVVSLDAWGTPPRRYAFPRRNRVIAALGHALVVVEAAMPSGTFSTAESAMELGREVLAVPGSIFSPQARGTNYLISVGAQSLVDEESIEVAISRIYGKLRFCRSAPQEDEARDEASLIYDALIASPARAGELAGALGLSERSCLLLLSQMQMDGRIERMVDGRFAPTKQSLHARSAIMHNR